MLGINYISANPTTHLIQYRNGRKVREGRGISFFYQTHISSVLGVPTASADCPFAFTETTVDFQQITVQGQVTYRIADPDKIIELLDFSINHKGAYLSDDPKQIQERLTQKLKVSLRNIVGHMKMRTALSKTKEITDELNKTIQSAKDISAMGIEVLDVSILAIVPNPEMAKALEAETREQLKQESDMAIYVRRNAAIDQERLVRENELNTEIAVEEKKRLIREKQIAADIAVEQQKQILIDQRVQNEKKEADSRSHSLRATLEPIKDIEWKKLVTVFGGSMEPKTMIAMAFREMAENAQKVGELNISSELLSSLMKGAGK